MSNKNLPKWYTRALNNKPFFDSDEYSMLLQDGIDEYNKALKDGDPRRIQKWKTYVLKWQHNRRSNEFMLMQMQH
jgi:hypothetical protein